MNKADFINTVAENTNFTKKDVGIVLDSMISVIQKTMGKGEEIRLAGFGNFSVKETAERSGHNPQTGEKITIPAGRKPKFSFAKAIKEAVKAS
nr:MAG TPA: DNA binding protein [Caudoviricetes sp.]